MHLSNRLVGAVSAALLIAACGTAGSPGSSSTGPSSTAASTTTAGTTPTPSTETTIPPEVLTLLTHDSFAAAVTDETFAAFTADTGFAVKVISAGDAGSMLSQAIITKDNPIADVMFGVDDTFLTRALTEEIFAPYESPILAEIPDRFELDPEHRVTPIDFGDVCLNYDRSVFAGVVAPPLNLEQLTNSEYADRLVVEDPATSSTGLAFLLATVGVFGEDGWQDYWRRLVDNGVKAVPDWDTAYYTEFSRYGGDRSIVVSYASSPVAEMIFSDPVPVEPPTAIVDEGCYRQIEFAGVLQGTEKPEAARRLIDFMASVPFQETIPLSWFVFPANENALLPDEFARFAVLPEAPLRMDPASIEEHRDEWIRQWAQIVLD